MFEGWSIFHESYYEHSCAVFSEKDVLFNDIVGQNWYTTIKRWWYNLFLLSYNDERCRIYYNSSQAMRLERSRQFRRYRGRIHPLSKFSNFWNCFFSVVLIWNRILFRHTTSIVFGPLPLFLYFTGVVAEFLVIMDLFINFKTGYIDEERRKIILGAKRGYIHYASTKLFAHVAGAIPLQTIMMMRYGMSVNCVICKANRFVCILRLLGLCSLYRLYDLSDYWARERGSFKLTYFLKFLRIGLLGMITMMQFLNLSNTVNILYMIEKENMILTSFITLEIQVHYWLTDPPSIWTSLCVEFSQMIKCLFLFGYGLQPKLFYLDVLFGVLGFLVANVFYIWSLLVCFAIINRQSFAEDQIEIHKERIKNLLRSRQLSDKVCSKVMDYYHFNISKLVLMEKANDLYQFLPTSLTKDIKINCYTRYIRRIPYFSEWPNRIIEDIVMMLKEQVFLQHDLINDPWTEGDGLVIVDTGILAVYTYDKVETGHLIDGDYYGEPSLVTDNEVRTSFVVAVSRCKVLMLNKNQFRQYMRDYPKLFYELRAQIRQKYAAEVLSETSLPELQQSETPGDPQINKPSDTLNK